MNKYISEFWKNPLVICTPSKKGKQVILNFSVDPPQEPGVYVICQRTNSKLFYVGEAGNLNGRLRFLFRCNAANNPHPCHRRHEEVFGSMPNVHVFCQTYGVRWLSTAGLIGRLEIEEELQKQLGTNRKRFYKEYDPECEPAENNFMSDQQLIPICLSGNEAEGEEIGGNSATSTANALSCSECPIWLELSSNPKYQNMQGISIPAMGGRAENLLFCYDPARDQVRVWREAGKPDFHFGEDICKLICRRYQQGLKDGFLPQPPKPGVTSYFNNPKWPKPPLGQNNTPYAAAVIRHVWP